MGDPEEDLPLLRATDPLPLYYQLQEAIAEEIRLDGKKPGDPLATEAKIAGQYKVSRATVRQALRILSEKGVVERRRGVGTFVGHGKLTENFPGLVSFSQEMAARGHTVMSRVLSAERMAPPSEVAAHLGLDDTSEVVRVRRVRFVDRQPIMISTSYLRPIVSLVEDFGGSIYHLLEERYGIKIASGRARIEAGLVRPEDATLLNLELGSPVLNICWLAVSSSNVPVEYSTAVFRADRYRYEVDLVSRSV